MEAQLEEELYLFYLYSEGELYLVEEKEPLVPLTPAIIAPRREPVTVAEPLPPVAERPAVNPPPVVPDEVPVSLPEPVSEMPPVVMAEEPQPPVEPELPKEVLPFVKETPASVPAVSEAPRARSSALLIIKESQVPLLPAEDKAFLEKVLQAVGLDLGAVDLVNVQKVAEPDYYYILRQKEVRYFISFGVPMPELKLYELLPYEVTYINGVRFLQADHIEMIRANNDRKRQLWDALRKMFGV